MEALRKTASKYAELTEKANVADAEHYAAKVAADAAAAAAVVARKAQGTAHADMSRALGGALEEQPAYQFVSAMEDRLQLRVYIEMRALVESCTLHAPLRRHNDTCASPALRRCIARLLRGEGGAPDVLPEQRDLAHALLCPLYARPPVLAYAGVRSLAVLAVVGARHRLPFELLVGTARYALPAAALEAPALSFGWYWRGLAWCTSRPPVYAPKTRTCPQALERPLDRALFEADVQLALWDAEHGPPAKRARRR